MEVFPKVIRIARMGGMYNSYVVRGERKSILVDTGLPGSEKAILNVLKKNDITLDAVSLILITHGHIDHFGSAKALKELTAAPIAIHGNDIEGPRQGTPVFMRPQGSVGKAMDIWFSRQRVEPISVDIELKGGESLLEFGINGKIVHTPGHTPGSISIVLSKEAIIGDMAVGQWFLSKKPAKQHLFCWNPQVNKNKLIRLINDYPIEILYSGHGGPLGSKEVLDQIFKGVN